MNLFAYADDILIYTNNKNENINKQILQKSLNIVEEWCCCWELKLQPQKCKVINFMRRRNNKIENLYTVNNIVIEEVKYLKYLGVILDQSLLFKEHIEYATKKSIN